MSWNVRGLGLGRRKKCDAVQDTIAVSHPHIVSIQESKLHSLDSRKLCSFLPPHLDSFAFAPAAGSRRGIVTSWDSGAVAASPPTISPHSLTLSFTSTTSGHSFNIVNVYAPSDHRDTDAFLNELSQTPTANGGNLLIIGDFNLTRSPLDKNNSSFDHRLAAKFNAALDGLGLIELPLLDQLYTWSNRRADPTLARLDHAFVNHDFSMLFPLASLR